MKHRFQQALAAALLLAGLAAPAQAANLERRVSKVSGKSLVGYTAPGGSGPFNESRNMPDPSHAIAAHAAGAVNSDGTGASVQGGVSFASAAGHVFGSDPFVGSRPAATGLDPDTRYAIQFQPIPIPEPAAWLLLAIGIPALLWRR